MRWLNKFPFNLILVLIICSYLLVAGLYAVFTPAWQAPDEPAHYNYVRYLAENGRFPVLHYGDYPHVYLEHIKAARFAPEMSIDPLRYEFWQPPLYYTLATPVYRLFGGALLPLRLLSVVLGAGLVVVACAIALEMRPGDTALALGVAAFVAFVPMHLAMLASVNNDALAELLLASVVLLLVRLGREPGVRSDLGAGGRSLAPRGRSMGVSRPARDRQAARLSYLLVIGLLLGLGLVTKATVYVAIPLALVALLMSEGRWASFAGRALALFIPALALALPWYARNVAVYGWPDLLGTINHAAVVAGQLRTADYLAAVGWATYLESFVTTTFHSFWGQFGWMAVPMDRRVYLALGLLSVLMVLGFVFFVWKGTDRGSGRTAHTHPTSAPSLDRDGTGGAGRSPSGKDWKIGSRETGMILMAAWLILTSLMYVYYNVTLVQFQGRYLFPMLIPIALLGVVGLREILSRRRAWAAAGICAAALIVIVVSSLGGGSLDKWGVLFAGGATLGFIVRRRLPSSFDGWLPAIPLAGLAGLSVYSLFAFVVPYLSP